MIHTVGPVWDGGDKAEPDLLCSAYRESLKLAHQLSLRSLAFPSISTGVYRFPIKLATELALQTTIKFCRENPEALDLVRFVTFSDKDEKVYLQVLNALSGAP